MYMLNMVIILIVMYCNVVTAIDKIPTYLLRFNTNCVGISQIRSVYQPVWMEEDDAMWFNFENMVFREIRAQDRVGRYHRLNQ